MKYVIVVDMQNDFINMALGTKEAVAILPKVKSKISEYVANGDEIIFTRDTHGEDYLSTREGKHLPVKHCVRGTEGHEICPELRPYAERVIDKETFGSVALAEAVRGYGEQVEEIVLLGLCTDICVISNAMLLKAEFPEADITVVSSASAGVTPESHETALAAMRAVQINIV